VESVIRSGEHIYFETMVSLDARDAALREMRGISERALIEYEQTILPAVRRAQKAFERAFQPMAEILAELERGER
jgi:hypothetical protein